jgi:GDP-L-fucose synthase
VQSPSKVLILGANGLVGSGICRAFLASRFADEWSLLRPSSSQLDLTREGQVNSYFEEIRPAWVILCAGKVGGIAHNIENQEKLFDQNLRINFNVLNAARTVKVPSLTLLSSSCIYPMEASSPLLETDIFQGLPHPTNEGYAAAKSLSIRQALIHSRILEGNWKVLIPTNVYGNEDHFDESGHVIPQLILRFHQAKILNHGSVSIWGDGTPIRDFVNSDDLGHAAIYLEDYFLPGQIINVGTNNPVTIGELAYLIANVVGYKGEVLFDESKPNGHPNKSINSDKINHLGWRSQVPLNLGLQKVYENFVSRLEVIGK